MLEPFDSIAHRLRVEPAERQQPMPGDTVVDAPDWSEDYAVDIAASIVQTWPHIVAATCPLVGWRTIRVEEPIALVLEVRRSFVHITWAFAVLETAATRCRLHVRLRARYLGPGTLRPIARAAHAVASLTDAAAERAMLEQIRAHAESAAQREQLV